MKGILTKAGWLVVAAALMTGISACNTADKLQPEDEMPSADAPKTYTLTVTATKGDDDSTRALSLDGKTLNAGWTVGDAVQVYRVRYPGTPYEEESLTTPNFTIYAQGSGATTALSGTITGSYIPAAGDVLRLRFLPYPDYTTQEGTLDYIATHCDFAQAEITVASVDAETGVITSTGPASFKNQQAIVKFSLKRPDGTTPVEASNLTVNVDNETYNVTLATPASDIFVAIKNVSNKAVSLTANDHSGYFAYDKSEVSFEKGKYYAVGVKMKRLMALGDIYYSDGTSSEMPEAGKTPIGVIAYLGTDAFSENGTVVEGIGEFTGHGLVLCLKNAARGTAANWSTKNVLTFDGGLLVSNVDDLMRMTDVSGYTNTAMMMKDTDSYPAATAVKYYDELPAPSGTTGWFLPSAQQWVKMLEGLGGLDESAILWKEYFDFGLGAIGEWDSAFFKMEEVEFDPMGGDWQDFQSSSECSIDANVCLRVNPQNKGIIFDICPKVGKNGIARARPVLAF